MTNDNTTHKAVLQNPMATLKWLLIYAHFFKTARCYRRMPGISQLTISDSMKSTCLLILIVSTLNFQGCAPTHPGLSRNPIDAPEFVAVILKDDSTALSKETKFFYQYRFGSREDDWNMSPEWALANLYHGGIKVIEAWYVRSTVPSSHRKFTTGTLYPPFLVVGLEYEDSYIEHYRYSKLDMFDPVDVSKAFFYQMVHYRYR